MKRIGILTSGGDASGMNAAVRAIARSAMNAGLEAYGVNYGYKGLVEGNIFKMESSQLDGIINRGGTSSLIFMRAIRLKRASSLWPTLLRSGQRTGRWKKKM